MDISMGSSACRSSRVGLREARDFGFGLTNSGLLGFIMLSASLCVLRSSMNSKFIPAASGRAFNLSRAADEVMKETAWPRATSPLATRTAGIRWPTERHVRHVYGYAIVRLVALAAGCE
eukprot:scaffold138490_cov28-Prasinocladus_malaysianus.AAC.1